MTLFPKNFEQFYSLKNNPKNLLEFLVKTGLINQNTRCSNLQCASKPIKLQPQRLKQRFIMRCLHCRRHFTARDKLFTLNSKSSLSIDKLLEIFWYWSHNHSVKFTHEQTGVSKKSIIKWFNKIRTILFEKMIQEPPMGGPGYTIQIDESLFFGKRKYNRGRILRGDMKHQADKNRNEQSKRNYGKRIHGPWVFGLVCRKISEVEIVKKTKDENRKRIQKEIKRIKANTNPKNLHKGNRAINVASNRIYGNNRSYKYRLISKVENPSKEVRMFVVDKRDKETLLPIILQNCKPGSEIVSDEWSSYRCLGRNGYTHYTVNHTENFVNPETGKNTQLIECLWNVAKYKIMRSVKGTTKDLLKGYLAEQWYRSINPNQGNLLFEKILFLLRDHSNKDPQISSTSFSKESFLEKIKENYQIFKDIFSLSNDELKKKLIEKQESHNLILNFPGSSEPTRHNDRIFHMSLIALIDLVNNS